MDSKTRASAETRFRSAQRSQEQGRNALTRQDSEARILSARTVQLKTARLARDAAEPAPLPKRASTPRKAGTRRGIGSY